MVACLEQLLANLLQMGGDDDEVAIGETQHDVAVTIPGGKIICRMERK